MDFTRITAAQSATLLIAFIDIQGFRALSQATPDSVALFTLLNGWARNIITETERGEGMVLKFIGDSALIIFPENKVDEGVLTLLSTREKSDAYFQSLGFNNRVRLTAHLGEVAIGMFGTEGAQRLDIIGDAVNVAAALGRGEHRSHLIISPQVFRHLASVTRKRFHKFTPPIVYLA
jgi:class 3 adenylate cyclase